MNRIKDEHEIPLKTRERILCTARDLFNEHTAGAISTNHIAAGMNISPGNLYYYFKNKEEIIREIYRQLFTLADGIWYHSELGKSEEGIIEYFKNLGSLMYDFRFFYLELNAILKNDPLLKKDYIERSERIVERMFIIYSAFIGTGVMRKIDSDREKKYMMRNIWIVGQMWMTYANIRHEKMTPEIVNDGVWQMYTVVEQLFTKKAKSKIENMLLAYFPV